jgi:hypothetical protein
LIDKKKLLQFYFRNDETTELGIVHKNILISHHDYKSAAVKKVLTNLFSQLQKSYSFSQKEGNVLDINDEQLQSILETVYFHLQMENLDDIISEFRRANKYSNLPNDLLKAVFVDTLLKKLYLPFLETKKRSRVNTNLNANVNARAGVITLTRSVEVKEYGEVFGDPLLIEFVGIDDTHLEITTVTNVNGKKVGKVVSFESPEAIQELHKIEILDINLKPLGPIMNIIVPILEKGLRIPTNEINDRIAQFENIRAATGSDMELPYMYRASLYILFIKQVAENLEKHKKNSANNGLIGAQNRLTYVKMPQKHVGKDKIQRVVYQKLNKLYVKRKCEDGTFKYVAIRGSKP